MAFKVPKDWEKDSDTLFIHKTGLRIHRMSYKSKDGWFFVPTDFKEEVAEFEPTAEGRDKAFEYWKTEVKGKKKKVTTTKPRKRKTKAQLEEEKAEKEEKAAEKKEESESDIDEGDDI